MTEMEAERLSASPLDYKVSKSELLRGIISDRLTAAAREIFAVVERTVSGYEEEAAGLRREIDRQRVQLEAILQPRVSLSRTDVDSWSCTTHVHTEEEEGQDEEDEEGEDEVEEELPEEPPKISRAKQRHLKDPDYQILGTRCPSLRRRRRRQDFIVLRVCLVRDFRGDSLNQCLYKHPIQKVRCPVGLREAKFLDLLKSTFPQLSAGFNTFTVNTSKRLVPLKLKKLTPEEIERTLRSTGRGRSALYLQVKTPGSTLTGPERRFPPHKTANDAGEACTRDSSVDMRDPWEPPVRLRVCLLKDSDEEALSQYGKRRRWSMSAATDIRWSCWYIKLPVQTMKFPPGLQEAEFLTLLRSALPQLTGDFETFAINSFRRMTPLKVNKLTPEEIKKSLRATGKGRSALYIREKKMVQSSSCSEQLPQIKEETASNTCHDEDSSPIDPAGGAQSNDRGRRPGNHGQQQETGDGGQQDMSEDLAALLSCSSDADSGDDEVTEGDTHAAVHRSSSADPGRGADGREECEPEDEETMVDSPQQKKPRVKRSRGRRRKKRRKTSTEGVGLRL